MARMREPYTGTVFEVAPSKVAARLARGYVLLEDFEPPVEVADEPEPELPEPEPDHENAPADAPKPTAESTIAEIRAWAKANGVALPKRGNKAQLLAAIG